MKTLEDVAEEALMQATKDEADWIENASSMEERETNVENERMWVCLEGG